jgi:hypothetical protein
MGGLCLPQSVQSVQSVFMKDLSGKTKTAGSTQKEGEMGEMLFEAETCAIVGAAMAVLENHWNIDGLV